MASAHKVKIAARLRPRLNGELDDESVKVYLGSEDTGESSSAMGSGRFISVTNPRDPSQVFKFPCVISETTLKGIYFNVDNRFTSCYDQSSTQEEIYQNDVQPMIDVVYSGVVSAGIYCYIGEMSFI